MSARVVIAPERWGSVDAQEVAQAMARGWQARSPSVQVRICAQSNGGSDLATVIAAAHPDAAMGVLTSDTALGSTQPVPYVQVEDEGARSAYLAMSLPTPAGQQRESPASSHAVGQAIRKLVAAGADRVVVGLADSGTLDGGSGLIAGLAGAAEDHEHPDAELATTARDVLRDHGVRLVAAYDVAIPLLGLGGAAATAQGDLGLDPYLAQAAEARMSRWAQEVAQALPARPDLLTGKAHRHDRTPGSGAGGGAGFALAALGAEVRPATQVVAEATGLRGAIGAGDLAVTGTLIFDWRQLTDSVVLQVGSTAQSLARPAVLLAGRVDVGRRELMSLGFSGGYGVVQSPRNPLPGDAAQILAAAEGLSYRVAGTWTPTHSTFDG